MQLNRKYQTGESLKTASEQDPTTVNNATSARKKWRAGKDVEILTHLENPLT